MTITAWYMDDDAAVDQREPHKLDGAPEVTLEMIAKLGVLHWSGLTGMDDPKLAQIREERGYNYSDVVNVHPDKLPDYENKIKSFFLEHIHYDEEIRYCVEGSGYFDVRDGEDKWIRVSLQAGDMIILPEGIYHRFDFTNFVLLVPIYAYLINYFLDIIILLINMNQIHVRRQKLHPSDASLRWRACLDSIQSRGDR